MVLRVQSAAPTQGHDGLSAGVGGGSGGAMCRIPLVAFGFWA